ncbi:VOC family protein [Actinosynnema sp. NPDC020468]|uniref:VOC family protein n=1 Tax=Actinosynnema sp. NPDC020468 TaxID=3154488 RepID=UPI0033FBFEDB
MPALDGSTHVALTVSDLDRSTEWYTAVLGMVVLEEIAPPEAGAVFRMLLHPRSFASLALGLPREPLPGPADERRPGLHHVAFHVPERADLDEHARHLDSIGVPHSGVRTSRYEPGWQLWLRDPDQIWVELYWVDRAQFLEGLRAAYRDRRGLFTDRTPR